MVVSKVDGRVARGSVAPMFGRLVPTTEETPASAATDRGHGQLAKGVDMNDRSNARSDERRLIALEYITRAVDDLARAAQSRLEYMRLARQYGATYREIATACGITETAVRMHLKRHQQRAELMGDLDHIYDPGRGA